MSTHRQIELRDEIGIKLLDEMKTNAITLAEALAALMGAAAALLALEPDHTQRQRAARLLTDDFGRRVEMRRLRLFGERHH